jgi:hypothetical protein
MAIVRWKAAVRYGAPGVLVGLAVSWIFTGSQAPAANAQVSRPLPADSPDLIAVTPTTPGPAQWLYLIDTKAQTFAVYRIDPNTTKATGAEPLKLEAVRRYRDDLKLTEFNNQPPGVRAIESMVRNHTATK